MPELPEVQTTVNGLNRTVKGLQVIDVWTNLKTKDPRQRETIKSPKYFLDFKKRIVGKNIIEAERRAKNILIHISNGETILIHLKMTGHLIYGRYEYNKKDNVWKPTKDERDSLHDPYNRFVRAVFVLNNGKHLAFCDTRKFGKIAIEKTSLIKESKHLSHLGPEPLEKSFTALKLKERLLKKKTGKIKSVLLDQSVVSGVGNIYSDELLWLAGINPKRKISEIKKDEFPKIYKAMVSVLKKGIDFGGDSTSDYRNIDGEHGKFHMSHNAYRKTGQKCNLKGCSGIIKREIIGGRSSHFCSKHQK